MSKTWITARFSGSQTSAGTLDNNALVYHNNSGQSTTTRKFDATIVARHLCVVSDTDDIWVARFVMVHESFPTLTVATPADADEKVHGVFPFCRGPVYFNPQSKISVPADHKLFLQLFKALGSTASAYHIQYRALLVTN